MDAVRMVEEWPVPHVATAVVAADGTVVGSRGDPDRVFPLASVTKLLSAYAVLVAVEEEAVGLDDAAGPEGSTIRHLLAHASGLDFSQDRVRAQPGQRRIYSNTGFDVLGDTIAGRTGIAFADYLREGVLEPLEMTATTLTGSPAAAGRSTVADLARFAAELQRPRVLAPHTLRTATRVAFAGLDGVLPGFGRQSPNDWGLGMEIRDHKSPHWTGSRNSPATFGHFGQSGTFCWIDPQAQVACVALTDRDFGDWAVQAWPAYADAVLDEVGRLSGS